MKNKLIPIIFSGVFLLASCGGNNSDPKPKTFLVKFVNDDVVLEEKQYEKGELPVYEGDVPTKVESARSTFTFSGWENDGNLYKGNLPLVTKDVTYSAAFDESLKQFTVTWKIGEESIDESYQYGQMPSYKGEDPSLEPTKEKEYQFIGWDKTLAQVTENVTYVAQFKENNRKYTISFYDYDGETWLDSQLVEYGKVPTYKKTLPSRQKDLRNTYEFEGWSDGTSVYKTSLPAVDGDVKYIASYKTTLNQYAVHFIVEGSEVYSSTCGYDQIPTYEGTAPSKPSEGEFSYIFDGWKLGEILYSEFLPNVKGEVTFVASFSKVEKKVPIKINYVNPDGSTFKAASEFEVSKNKEFTFDTTIEGKAVSQKYIKDIALTDDPKEYTITVSDMEIYDGTSVSTSLSGEGSESRPYLIQSGADLAFFRSQINSWTDLYEGKYVKLTKSIDVSADDKFIIGAQETIANPNYVDEETTPDERPYISDAAQTLFSGIFDGSGCVIKENLDSTLTKSALFSGITSTATIKNLSIDGGARVAQYGGALCGRILGGTIENCINMADVSQDGANGTGGLIGSASLAGSKVIDCLNFGNVTLLSTSNNKTSGIISTVEKDATIANCINYGNVTCNIMGGGIFGEIQAAANNTEVSDCINYGTVLSVSTAKSQKTGGIGGSFNGILMANCTNNGEIRTSATNVVDVYTGGIVGMATANANYGSTVKNCINNGAVFGCSRTAGLIGEIDAGTSKKYDVIDCVNNGEVKSIYTSTGGDYIGGICGVAGKAGGVNFIRCANNGKITGKSQAAGGICGAIATNALVSFTSCTNNATVTGKIYVSGICGGAYLGTSTAVTFTSCANMASVSGSKYVGGILGIYLEAFASNIVLTGSICEGVVTGSDLYGPEVGGTK